MLLKPLCARAAKLQQIAKLLAISGNLSLIKNRNCKFKSSQGRSGSNPSLQPKKPLSQSINASKKFATPIVKLCGLSVAHDHSCAATDSSHAAPTDFGDA
jgi:hypothetical protein